MLTPARVTTSRFPRTLLTRGLQFTSYLGVAFICMLFSFAIGESRANAAACTTSGYTVVFDATFTTNGTGESITLPIGANSGNSFGSGMCINWDFGVTGFSTSPTSFNDAAGLTFNPSGTTAAAAGVVSVGTYRVVVYIPNAGLAGLTHFGNTHSAVGTPKPWTVGASYLMGVNSWSTFTNLEGAFVGATNLTSLPVGLPTNTVNNLSYAFYGASSINSPNDIRPRFFCQALKR